MYIIKKNSFYIKYGFLFRPKTNAPTNKDDPSVDPLFDMKIKPKMLLRSVRSSLS